MFFKVSINSFRNIPFSHVAIEWSLFCFSSLSDEQLGKRVAIIVDHCCRNKHEIHAAKIQRIEYSNKNLSMCGKKRTESNCQPALSNELRTLTPSQKQWTRQKVSPNSCHLQKSFFYSFFIHVMVDWIHLSMWIKTFFILINFQAKQSRIWSLLFHANECLLAWEIHFRF